MNKFKPGDIVQLNSGGPSMTVVDWTTSAPMTVVCVWFINGELKKEAFIPQTIWLVRSNTEK